MPFLSFAIIQIAHSHLSKPSAESSIMVPCLTLNCFLQDLHFQMRRVDKKLLSLDSQFGQTATPSAQRREATNCKAISGSAKYLMASCRVFGKLSTWFSIATI